ncbi:MAG TPA: hypothetical protein VL854_01515 [Nitrososphaeraceae archaeon]|nr:hypothetical protein [Nitrososphaeraceae archaeon]
MDREIYQKIIHVKKWLNGSSVEKKKNLDIYGVINYVFDEYIKHNRIDSKQRITLKMIREIDQSYQNDEINMDICKLSKNDINIVRNYIFSDMEPENNHSLDDFFKSIEMLDKMKRNCIID